ncbi:hypothetical protein RJ640_010929 [Escallonia rubra]|uniref:Retrotransposon gag domain-containing protein n=1 Tax=Escallonia rubra TaxID=112253 RepID=A0AA88RC67_9ASTE|nr:hypothetical protein RJ640_010929 [Escallonia rubra]
MVTPNQVVVPVSKPSVKPRVQFREVVVSRYEKGDVSGSKVPHLELEENTLHEMPPPSFQHALDADSSTGSQSGSSPRSPKHLVSSPRSESHTLAPPVTMQVMMTGSMSIEEQLATMSRAFQKLTKTVEEKDFQIATLMNKLELTTNDESNRGTEGDLLVKQFVRSLKGNVFDWNTDIEPDSINCWEAMEREFLNWFYSSRRSVSMMELTNTRQWKDEPVVDYINRWRSLSLDCKERLSEISTVEMCIQGMHWGLLYILQGNRPASFEELATRAHDMEISIANHGGNSPALHDPRKDKREGKKVERCSRTTGKESLAVTTAHLKVPKKDKHKEEKAPKHLEEKPRQQPSLKELGGKSKHLEELERVKEARYCKYHRILGHKTEKCFILKELIMNLAKKGKIKLDIDGVEESNHALVISSDVTPLKGPNTSNNTLTMGARMMTIQFGTLDPVKVLVPQKMSEVSTQGDQFVDTNDDGWTLVTRRKSKKQPVTLLQPFRREKRRVKKRQAGTP